MTTNTTRPSALYVAASFDLSHIIAIGSKISPGALVWYSATPNAVPTNGHSHHITSPMNVTATGAGASGLVPKNVWQTRKSFALLTTFFIGGAVIAPQAFAQSSKASSKAPFVVPAWAFPTSPAPNPAPKPDSVVLHRVPNSTREYTMRQVGNAFDIPDWFPESHPAMPAPVQHGARPNARACGYCHLPDGQGRPENGTLAGLPVDYIVKQVRAFRDSTRLAANPAAKTNSMHLVATGTSDADVEIAARYFASLKLTRRNIVREVTQVPKTRIEVMLYAYDGTGTETIDDRLIEVPETFERHELRDPTVVYTTYVPVGSIARGKRLAANGPNGAATTCTTCHGPQLLGKDGVPPIAGRSPSNILRQLMNFRTGARHDSLSITMTPVVEKLSVRDMVSLAAYVGSMPPSAPVKVKRRKS